ncbi:MAG TPA: hypothetical protein VI455_03360 [Terriglobia bacterium]
MPAMRPFAEGSKEKLRVALKRAQTKAQFQTVQCLWLRAALGLNAEQVAIALGWTAGAVRKLQSQYLRKGEAVLEGPGRGGRRRQLLGLHGEYNLLRRLRKEAWPSGVLEFRKIHAEMEKAAGRELLPSTVNKILERHGWRRQALVTIPWHKVPPGMEPPPPNRTGVWYMPTEDPGGYGLPSDSGSDPK